MTSSPSRWNFFSPFIRYFFPSFQHLQLTYVITLFNSKTLPITQHIAESTEYRISLASYLTITNSIYISFFEYCTSIFAINKINYLKKKKRKFFSKKEDFIYKKKIIEILCEWPMQWIYSSVTHDNDATAIRTGSRFGVGNVCVREKGKHSRASEMERDQEAREWNR